MRRAYLSVVGQATDVERGALIRAGVTGAAGVRVVEVQPGSAAAEADLRSGDVIVTLAEIRIESADDLQRALPAQVIGSRIRVVVVRGGEPVELWARPTELPDADR